jgi:hypothetical protein
MKRLFLVIAMATVAVATCWQQAAAQHGMAGSRSSEHGAMKSTTGKVVETMNAAGYTYVQVDGGAQKIWAAAPQFAVAVGDTVVVPSGMPMRDFYSKTLKRTFDLVYFVSSIEVLGTQTADRKVMAAHGAGAATPPAVAVDLSNIKKPEGGETVAELYAKKAALAGKAVVVRGRVVKFTAAVMGKNWIHVRDGTGTKGSDDLTITTSTTATVGNTVLVRGKLSTDRDFGFGYRYDILIEDAKVDVE